MGLSFFEVFFGEKLSWDDAVQKQRELDILVAHSQAVNLLTICKFVEKQLTKAVEAHDKFYNKKH